MLPDLMTQPAASTDHEAWTNTWLDAVVAGTSTMSQRKLTSIEKHGGLAEVRRLAKAKSVHLLLVEDDKGNELVAASLKPFKVVC